jgi:hypothetical protein
VKLGIDRPARGPRLRRPLAGRRLGLVAHPASVTTTLEHSLDALAACGDLRVTAAFGPQHGLRGDKQDNMIESPDFEDPCTTCRSSASTARCAGRRRDAGRRATSSSSTCRTSGTRIYTFITTLRYVLEAAAASRKAVWVLDRPNPIGRPVEGLTLRPGQESFVGAGRCRCGTASRWASSAAGSSARSARRRVRGRADGRLAARRGAGLRLAARRAHVGEPEPEHPVAVDRAAVSGHRAARRHDALGRAWHDAAARGARARPTSIRARSSRR